MPLVPFRTGGTDEEKPVLPDIRPKYKIEINGLNHLRKTIETLFSHGYVWDANFRFRKFDNVFNIYSSVMHEWKYITTHFDEDCKMVIGRLNCWEWASVIKEYKTVTLDEFLYAIAGHERRKAEEKKIVTIEEFNEEFKEFQRRTYPTFESQLAECDRINDAIIQETFEEPLTINEENIPGLADMVREEIDREILETLRERMPEAIDSIVSLTRREGTTPHYMNLVINSRNERRRRRRRRITRNNNDA